MAIGPGGTAPTPLPPSDDEEAAGFLRGLEGIIDRALRNHPPGDTFVYGIHQDIAAEQLEPLLERYRAAGWGEAKLRPGLTGAVLLVLVP